jgi:Transposase DDE domain group 1
VIAAAGRDAITSASRDSPEKRDLSNAVRPRAREAPAGCRRSNRGDLERCALRAGNVHSAHGWREVLDPVIARYCGQAVRRLLRGDAAFALPDVYEYLEAEGFQYTIRLPANQVLQAQIAHLLTRPVGRPPHSVRRFYASFRYRAQSWSRSRRVVAKVEWYPGELYPRVGFIVTNLRRLARKAAFYNGRGTAAQWIKLFHTT